MDIYVPTHSHTHILQISVWKLFLKAKFKKEIFMIKLKWDGWTD